MDDLNAFERLVAREVLVEAGPSRPVEVLAIVQSITGRDPKARFESMFSATKVFIAAAIVALFGSVVITGVLTEPPSHEPRSVGAAVSPSPSLLPANDSDDGYLSGRRSLTVDGVPLSFDVSTDSGTTWESLKDGLYISSSTADGQAAEAIILWTSFPDSRIARPCLLSPSDVSSAADLAAAVAAAPGIELVSGPSDVTVGGRAAKYVAVTVVPALPTYRLTRSEIPTDLGCDPGYFFGWEPHAMGAFWTDTQPGDTIQVWIVEVDGKTLFIEAETTPDAGTTVEHEIERIVDSIRFE